MGRYRDKAILVDFGQGAYGPTILIDTQSAKALGRLIDTCMQLARLSTDQVELLALDGVFHSYAINSLMLLADPAASKLEVVSAGPQGHSLSWREPPDRWRHCADLLEVLLSSQLPGHQYLTEEGDDILVVVQFLEPDTLDPRGPKGK